MVETIADLVKAKKIIGISDLETKAGRKESE